MFALEMLADGRELWVRPVAVKAVAELGPDTCRVLVGARWVQVKGSAEQVSGDVQNFERAEREQRLRDAQGAVQAMIRDYADSMREVLGPHPGL